VNVSWCNGHCIFCNKNRLEVELLVPISGVYICNECVDMCHDIVHEELEGLSTYQHKTLDQHLGIPCQVFA